MQAKYRVYALDLYGFGDSGKNAARYSLEHQIELLSDFMTELGIPKAALIGHGLGALVSAEFARRYEERVARMMLIGAPLFDPGDLDRRTPAGRKVLFTNNRPSQLDANPDFSSSSQTIMSPTAAMRAALMEAARARATGGTSAASSTPPDATINRADLVIEPARNPLQPALENGAEALLARCFKRSEPEYDKLRVDVVKTDPSVIRQSASLFDAGRMLDTLRLLAMPTVVLHGLADPIIPPPSEEVWNYLTLDKEALLLPMTLPDVRHFPMLEYDRFFTLLNNFLETPDVSKIEVKERWRRRTR